MSVCPIEFHGVKEVQTLEAEGWVFCGDGVKEGGRFVVVATRGDVTRLVTMADPEVYPEKWNEFEPLQLELPV